MFPTYRNKKLRCFHYFVSSLEATCPLNTMTLLEKNTSIGKSREGAADRCVVINDSQMGFLVGGSNPFAKKIVKMGILPK